MAKSLPAGAEGDWVEAGPFRAHLQQLMTTGGLTAREAATLTGLSARAVQHILTGRHGRSQRRICPDTARRLLQVGVGDASGLRWCLTPNAPARSAYQQLLAAGWTRGHIAAAVRAPVGELDALPGTRHCTRLLAVRLLSLAEAPTRPPLDDETDLARAA